MKVLIISAHPDDEVLGAGGTILKHKSQGDKVYICVVTRGYEPEWSREYIQNKLKEAKKVDKILGTDERIFCGFPAVKLNTIPYGKFNKKISDVIEHVDPDVIYTHFWQDVHRDHGTIFDAVMVGSRPRKNNKIRLLCFETLSSTEWGYEAFSPNVYVDITDFIDKKIEAFLTYRSEVKKFPHPRSEEGIRILAKKRGMEACVEYAEAFVLIRDYW